MLKHLNQKGKKPARVVILGAHGFVGSAINARLTKAGIITLTLARQQIDLLTDNAAEQLASIMTADDALVIASAEVPCKNRTTLMNNIAMMKAICEALDKQAVHHIIYMSSDAVYSDSEQPLTERSLTTPTSLHGIMHLTRELMLRTITAPTPLMCLRPSLLYGATDPHNGYGPNQFHHLAATGKPIVLFGDGEEQRDHVFIADLAELTYLCLLHRSQGLLNVATGNVTSFRKVAEMINSLFALPGTIHTRSRNGPMPHNGYRAFNQNTCKQAFPNFHYTQLKKGLMITHHDMLTGGLSDG